MRYFIKLSYQGSKYRGWQTQANVRSVQETLEACISKMIGQKKTVHGCGRTDAQVHASTYFAHLNVEEDFDYDPVFRLNKMLPPDIRIQDFIKVNGNHNAQLSALSRTYEYHIHSNEDPFIYETSWHYPDLQTLDKEAMQNGLNFLLDHVDYYSLCRQPNIYPHTDCFISLATLTYDEDMHSAKIRIRGNRFLKSMIRVIVARLVEIGRGKLSLETFKNKIKQREPFEPLTLAPPQGLRLVMISYPFLNEKGVFTGEISQT